MLLKSDLINKKKNLFCEEFNSLATFVQHFWKLFENKEICRVVMMQDLFLSPEQNNLI